MNNKQLARLSSKMKKAVKNGRSQSYLIKLANRKGLFGDDASRMASEVIDNTTITHFNGRYTARDNGRRL